MDTSTPPTRMETGSPPGSQVTFPSHFLGSPSSFTRGSSFLRSFLNREAFTVTTL